MALGEMVLFEMLGTYGIMLIRDTLIDWDDFV